MRWDKVHQGIYKQGPMTEDEIKAAEDRGEIPGINPDLRAPVISPPEAEPELNLHGDIAGSPFSSTPGEISLADADAKEKAEAGNPAADDAATREREVESRRTGVSATTLAQEEEAGDETPPKPASKSSKK